MGKTRATDTVKRHNILEKGRFLLADYCKIGVLEKGRFLIKAGRITKRNEPNY